MSTAPEQIVFDALSGRGDMEEAEVVVEALRDANLLTDPAEIARLRAGLEKVQAAVERNQGWYDEDLATGNADPMFVRGWKSATKRIAGTCSAAVAALEEETDG